MSYKFSCIVGGMQTQFVAFAKEKGQGYFYFLTSKKFFSKENGPKGTFKKIRLLPCKISETKSKGQNATQDRGGVASARSGACDRRGHWRHKLPMGRLGHQ